MRELKQHIEIIGLDLSLTGSGWCSIDPSIDLVEYGEIKTESGQFTTRRARVMHIAGEIKHVITRAPLKHSIIFIESYAFSKRTNNLTQLGELGMIIRQLVYSKTKLDAIEVPNGSLKKFITGSGQGKKEDLKLASYKKYNVQYNVDFQGKSNNECDAFCLAVLGKSLLGLAGKLTAYEREAIITTYKGSKYEADQVLKEIF